MATHTQPWTSSTYWQETGPGASEATAFANLNIARRTFRARTEASRPATYAPAARVPAWIEPTFHALKGLLQLPKDWDGYGASPVQERIAQRVLFVLCEVMEDDAPPPSVVPLTGGGIQVEWHRLEKNLEIEFPADAAPSFYYYEENSDLESEGQVSGNYDRIQAYISALR